MNRALSFAVAVKDSAYMDNRQVIYRPEWTCGRYNPEADTAIMYNLLNGVSSFFESYSARVIGEILSIPKNGRGTAEDIAEHTGIAVESITGFLQVLKENGLVSDRLLSREEITLMRRRQGEIFRRNPPKTDFGESTGQIDMSNAEQMYADSLDIRKCVPSVMFELTYNCSERCVHCYNSGAVRSDCEVSGRNREELTLPDYRKVIDELYDMGLYKVCLTGGDPFSKPHIWEIIDYIYNKDIAIDIFTNGQSIVRDADRLAWYWPRLVGLSIYSAVPEVHDRITRVKGSLERTLSVAGRLSDLGVNMAFKCVVFRTNIKSYRTVKGLADRYGAVAQFEINLTNGVDGDVSVVENLGLPDEIMEILLRDPNIPLFVGENTSGTMVKPLDAHPCRAGVQSFSITPEGEVHPCCAFPTSFGNVRNSSMRQILNSGSLDKWRKVSIGDIVGCGRYEKCRYCFLCVGNGFIEHGTPFRSPSASCHMAELRYGLAIKLREGRDPLMGKTVDERLSEIDVPGTGNFSRHMNESYRNRTL